MVKEFISKLPPDKLTPFKKHPYQVREDAAMDELVESVRTYGILSPLLARPKGEGYELVSGHRRRLAAQKLGLPTVPVLVREMTDDEAVILMVDSIPAFCRRSRTPQRTSCWKPSSARWRKHRASTRT